MYSVILHRLAKLQKTHNSLVVPELQPPNRSKEGAQEGVVIMPQTGQSLGTVAVSIRPILMYS